MVEVCIGSACHLKGSYEVIQRMKEFIEEYDLKDKVELKSAFCLGACGKGVSIRLNNDQVYSISPVDSKAFFEEHILSVYK